MGSQYTAGTLTGQTSGSFTGVDYTLDFDTLSAEISGLRASLETKLDITNGHLADMKLGFTNAFDPSTAGATPGSIANRIQKNSQVMAALVEQTGNLAKAVQTVGYDTREGAKTPLSIAGQLAVLNANLQIIGTNVIKANTFNQAATNAALARNDLPPVSDPTATLQETVATAASDATTMGVQAKATGLVTGVIDNVTSEVSAIGGQVLSPITSWFTSTYESTKAALGLTTGTETAVTTETTATTASSIANG